MQPNIFFVFLPCLSFCLTLFISFPAISQLIIKLACLEVNGGHNCDSANVSSRASMINLCTSLISSIPSIILSGFYGSIADRYGRKFAMLFPFGGALIHTLMFYYLALVQPENYALVAIVSALISGLSGGFGVFLMIIFSCVSDITSDAPAERGHSHSIIEAALFIAKIFGPACTGMLISHYGFVSPLLLALGTCLMGIISTFLIPDSLASDASTRKVPIRFDVLKTFRNIRFLFSIQPARGRSPIPWVVGAFFLYFIALMGETALFIVYVKHVYHWDPQLIGFFVAMEGILQMFCLFIVPKAVDGILRNKVQDIVWVQLGFFSRYAIVRIHMYIYLFKYVKY